MAYALSASSSRARRLTRHPVLHPVVLSPLDLQRAGYGAGEIGIVGGIDVASGEQAVEMRLVAVGGLHSPQSR